jgi:hypothetical protein
MNSKAQRFESDVVKVRNIVVVILLFGQEQETKSVSVCMYVCGKGELCVRVLLCRLTPFPDDSVKEFVFLLLA